VGFSGNEFRVNESKCIAVGDDVMRIRGPERADCIRRNPWQKPNPNPGCEDDLDVAEMLNAYFRVQGYEVYTVNWAKTACARARPFIRSCDCCDIRLPDIDGYEVAKRLRQRPPYPGYSNHLPDGKARGVRIACKASSWRG